jgi:hypothetical protein
LSRDAGAAGRTRCPSARGRDRKCPWRQEHHDDRDAAEEDEIDRAEIGKVILHQREDGDADDRPFDRADAADHHDEDQRPMSQGCQGATVEMHGTSPISHWVETGFVVWLGAATRLDARTAPEAAVS